MFAKLTRAAAATFVATAALAVPAFAQGNDVRVEYRDFGQGRVPVVIQTNNDRAYALTGRSAQANWNNQNVRIVDTGQGRLVLPR